MLELGHDDSSLGACTPSSMVLSWFSWLSTYPRTIVCSQRQRPCFISHHPENLASVKKKKKKQVSMWMNEWIKHLTGARHSSLHSKKIILGTFVFGTAQPPLPLSEGTLTSFSSFSMVPDWWDYTHVPCPLWSGNKTKSIRCPLLIILSLSWGTQRLKVAFRLLAPNQTLPSMNFLLDFLGKLNSLLVPKFLHIKHCLSPFIFL